MSVSQYLNSQGGPVHIAIKPPPFGKDSPYTSGDIIHGIVSVKPTAKPQCVVLHLKGRSRFVGGHSASTTTISYREKIPLFCHTLHLFSSALPGQSYDILDMGILENDRVDLPFEFTFPHIVELDSPSVRSVMGFIEPTPRPYNPREGFQHKAGFILPPSYENVQSTGEQIVEYYLEAQMFKEAEPQADDKADTTVRQHVQFLPPGPVLPGEEVIGYVQDRQMTIRCETHKLNPDYDADESRLSRIKSRLKKLDSSTPSATFKLHAKVPRITTPDEIINHITFSLLHTERSDIIKEPPPVYLQQIRIRLISTMHVRIPCFHGDEDVNDIHTADGYLLNRQFGGTGRLLYNGMKLDGLERRALDEIVPDSPDFSCYGLNLSHEIRVVIWIECAGETYELLACKGKITIVPNPKMGGQGALQDAGRVSPSDALGMDGKTAPPPYEPPPYEE